MIVGGLFSTHIPRLMIFGSAARSEYMGPGVTTFYDALPQIKRERIDPLEIDTFVVIDTHWHTTLEFILNAHDRHEGLYTSDEIPWMIHEYPYDYPGDPELAALIAEESLARGVPAEAAAHAAEGTSPGEDMHADREYRRHLARVLTRRALEHQT